MNSAQFIDLMEDDDVINALSKSVPHDNLFWPFIWAFVQVMQEATPRPDLYAQMKKRNDKVGEVSQREFVHLALQSVDEKSLARRQAIINWFGPVKTARFVAANPQHTALLREMCRLAYALFRFNPQWTGGLSEQNMRKAEETYASLCIPDAAIRFTEPGDIEIIKLNKETCHVTNRTDSSTVAKCDRRVDGAIRARSAEYYFCQVGDDMAHSCQV